MAVFVIQELINNNPTTTGVRFEWSDSRGDVTPERNEANLDNDLGLVGGPVAKGKTISGYYAAPQGTWDNELAMRIKRTDYPGVSRPSVQILGSNHEDFSLSGMWDDRYNYAGFAKETWRALERLIQSGNLCRFQYDDIVYHGTITKLNTQVELASRIMYTITVSPHYKDVDPGSVQRQADKAVLTVGDVYNRLDQSVANLQVANQDRIDARFTASVLASVDRSISRIDQSRATVGLSIDVGKLNPLETPITQWNKFASQFVEAQVANEELLTVMAPVRADLDIISPSAVVMLSFESWSRTVKSAARAARYAAMVSVKEMRKRFKPKAATLYRPYAGESIFAISNKFYGTPTQWRIIADRNGINYYEFTGDEILAIPDRGTL